MEGIRVLTLTYRADELPPELLQLLAGLHGGRGARSGGRVPITGSASIDEGGRKLAVQLGGGQRLELPVPRRALRWLREREREVAPLKPAKTALARWRGGKLEVQIALKVRRPKPERPDPRKALLCYARVTGYGVAVVISSFDEEYTKIHEAMKLVPPAVRLWLREAAKSAAASGEPGASWARLLEGFDASGWVRAAAAEIFKRAAKRARGRSILMNIDAPGGEAARGSRLRRTLLSMREVAENLANWCGVYATFERYPSRECPLCGRELRELGTGLARVARCECGFYEDSDYVPFYHWFRALNLPLPKHPLRQLREPSGPGA